MESLDWVELSNADLEPPTWTGLPDGHVEPLLLSIGSFITEWEQMLSDAAELYDLLATYPHSDSTRIAFDAFCRISSPLGQAAAIRTASKRARIPIEYQSKVEKIGVWLEKITPQRNNIAHGRVYKLGPNAFCLAPNNVSVKKWHPYGDAKYQLNSQLNAKTMKVLRTLHDDMLWLIKEISVSDQL